MQYNICPNDIDYEFVISCFFPLLLYIP